MDVFPTHLVVVEHPNQTTSPYRQIPSNEFFRGPTVRIISYFGDWLMFTIDFQGPYPRIDGRDLLQNSPTVHRFSKAVGEHRVEHTVTITFLGEVLVENDFRASCYAGLGAKA